MTSSQNVTNLVIFRFGGDKIFQVFLRYHWGNPKFSDLWPNVRSGPSCAVVWPAKRPETWPNVPDPVWPNDRKPAKNLNTNMKLDFRWKKTTMIRSKIWTVFGTRIRPDTMGKTLCELYPCPKYPSYLAPNWGNHMNPAVQISLSREAILNVCGSDPMGYGS